MQRTTRKRGTAQRSQANKAGTQRGAARTRAVRVHERADLLQQRLGREAAPQLPAVQQPEPQREAARKLLGGCSTRCRCRRLLRLLLGRRRGGGGGGGGGNGGPGGALGPRRQQLQHQGGARLEAQLLGESDGEGALQVGEQVGEL